MKRLLLLGDDDYGDDNEDDSHDDHDATFMSIAMVVMLMLV